VLRGHFDSVYLANFSNEGSLIISASKDETIRIWDVETGDCLKVLEGHTGTV